MKKLATILLIALSFSLMAKEPVKKSSKPEQERKTESIMIPQPIIWSIPKIEIHIDSVTIVPWLIIEKELELEVTDL